jgi:hypothetical protein
MNLSARDLSRSAIFDRIEGLFDLECTQKRLGYRSPATAKQRRSPRTGARQVGSTAISVERLTIPYRAVRRLGEPPGFSELIAVVPVSSPAITSPDIRP